MNGGRLLSWALTLLGPSALLAQAPSPYAPARLGTIPSGPPAIAAPLPVAPAAPPLPVAPAAPPSEFGVGVAPPSTPNTPLFLDRPRHPTPPPAGFTSSNCNFDAMCGDNVYSPDYGSFQVLFGYYFSSKIGPGIPAFDYIPLTLRRTWMITAPSDESLYRGNWEIVGDFTTAGMTSDLGSVFAGPSVFLRYNFLGHDSNIVPYVQTGAGFILNDAYKDRTQRAIGQQFEFYLHAQAGLRYFISKNVSLDLELGLQHISNANMADRNLGVNALGAMIGFSYFFPSGAR